MYKAFTTKHVKQLRKNVYTSFTTQHENRKNICNVTLKLICTCMYTHTRTCTHDELTCRAHTTYVVDPFQNEHDTF